MKDNINNTQSSFIYDLIGRLVKSKDSQGNSWTYGYDEFNNMNSIAKSQYGVSEKESITFDKDNKVTTFKLESGSNTLLNQTLSYDPLGRMTGVETKNGAGSTIVDKDFEFIPGTAANTTTTLVSKEKLGGQVDKQYTYDAKGNILSITTSAGVITYTYDLISQLTKETNGITGETIDYVYDTGGNILSKTITKAGVSRTYNYGYNDTNWKDKLTSFDGQNILYDPIGNPLSLNGASLGWTQGRKLSTYTKGSTTAYYTYDENGIRKSKYVNGTTTEYLTSGGEVVAQKTGANVITYTRGGDGSLISMNRNGTIYYYQTNLQGDVEKILDASGTEVVSYTYDAFGRITSMTGDQTLGKENPFRYRSYFFDEESGLYYLQSRFYDPMMGRFISADDRLVENGNMFSYCSNSPVMNVDPDGHDWWNNFLNKIGKAIRKVLNYAFNIEIHPIVYSGTPVSKNKEKSKNKNGQSVTKESELLYFSPDLIDELAAYKPLSEITMDEGFKTGAQIAIDAGLVKKLKVNGQVFSYALIGLQLAGTIFSEYNNQYNASLVNELSDANNGNGVYLYKEETYMVTGSGSFMIIDRKNIVIPAEQMEGY